MNMERIEQWFQGRGWEVFPFQREVWNAYSSGESGLIHSATGTGKTLAAWMGPLIEGMASDQAGLKVLWITPLRALAADTLKSLQEPLEDLGCRWRVESRTGDTSSSVRARQAKSLPDALVTTPESLSLMLTRSDVDQVLGALTCVIVDEWHELLSTKRGVQTELALARLRQLAPNLRIWGLSATLGNLTESLDALVGDSPLPRRLIQGEFRKEIIIDSILPESVDRFPWAGHFGTQMIPQVIETIADSGSTLVFCNTRAMAEIWFQTIKDARPDWDGEIALHHGSLDREVRDKTETDLKEGRLRAVVCTSSLDLGVDFSPVERVLQVGSPKGVARLLQRAGRSGHRPGVASRVTCVPTHALEILDISSARDAAYAGRVESRAPLRKPLDVLAQHLVSIAGGPGFQEEAMLKEVRSTYAYRELQDEEWQWCLDFITRGGKSLTAYPEYRKVVLTNGVYRIASDDILKRHRMTIGTITSDAAMSVQYVGGGRLGTVEEGFLARLNPGDKFLFAGRPLEFVRIKDMTAWVKRASSTKGAVPRWAGGRLPLSTELAHAIRSSLAEAEGGAYRTGEMQLLQPLLELQQRWSALPTKERILIESVKTREGFHLFFYPLEGRLVHEGLAALLAFRLSRVAPITFTVACNDYGFELLSPDPAPIEEALESGLFSAKGLSDDIAASLNSVELAKRQFREIARVAGLVFPGYPGMEKRAKQIQATAGLFFDVFERYDPDNMLLQQAYREVLEKQLEESRLVQTLRRLECTPVHLAKPPRPTPFSFPILVDRLRDTVSSETLADRIQKMVGTFEREAGPVQPQ